jgi:hypothetical protein
LRCTWLWTWSVDRLSILATVTARSQEITGLYHNRSDGVLNRIKDKDTEVDQYAPTRRSAITWFFDLFSRVAGSGTRTSPRRSCRFQEKSVHPLHVALYIHVPFTLQCYRELAVSAVRTYRVPLSQCRIETTSCSGREGCRAIQKACTLQAVWHVIKTSV